MRNPAAGKPVQGASEEFLRELLLAAASPDNLDAFLRRVIKTLSRPDALGPAAGLSVMLDKGENAAPLTVSLNFTKKELARRGSPEQMSGILSSPVQGGATAGFLLARPHARAAGAFAGQLVQIAARTISGRLAQESREGQLTRERDVADAVTHLEELYLAFPAISLEEISRIVLDEARRLTGSRFGFAGYISSATGHLVIPAFTREAMKSSQRHRKELVLKEFTGLWGWVLKHKKPLVTNSAATDPRAAGTISSNIKISRFAGAPAISGKELIGMLALVNPPADYTPAAIDALKKLARVYALMLRHKLAEQQQAETANNLAESELKYKKIFQMANTAIILADTATGLIVDANKDAEKLLGRSRKEIIGMHQSRLHPPEAAELYKQEFRDRVRDGSSRLGHSEIIRKDGSKVQVLISASKLTLKGREVLQGIFYDISERLKTEEKYRALVESTDTGYLILNSQGQVVDANKEYLRLTGRKRMRDILGRRVTEWTAPYDKARNRREIEKCIKVGHARNLSVDYMDRRGQAIPIEINATVVKMGDTYQIVALCRDITRRKQAEADLVEQAALLRAQQEASPDAILVVDKDGQIRSFNRHFTKMWGLPHKLMAIGSDKMALQAVRAKLSDPEAFLKRVEYLYRHPHEESRDELFLRDGRILERYSTAILGKEGEYYGRVWHFHDISKRRIAETRIRESEEKYRRLVENLGKEYFFYQHDKKGIFNYLSPTITDTLGYSQKEFLTHFTRYLTDNPRNRDVEKYTALTLRGIQQPAYEVEIYHKNGSIHWLEVTETPLRGPDGKITGVEGLAHDITARKLEGKALRESEARYKTLLSGLGTGILVADIRTRKFIYANPALCRMFGYTEKELTRLGVQDIHPKEALPYVIADFEAQARGEKVLAPDLPCLRKDGVVIRVNIHTVRLVLDGRDCLMGQFTDITESKRLENILKINEEKYRALFETSRDALMILEPPHWKFGQANKATLKMFGAPDEKRFLKLTPWAISPRKQPDGSVSAEKAKEMLKIALKTGSNYFQWEHKRLYGPVFSAEVLLTRVDIGDKQIIQASIRDISARKRIEEQLRLSELRQHLAMSQINGVLWVLDKTLRFTLSRGQGLASLGLKPDQLMGMTLEEFIRPIGPDSPSLAAHRSALLGKNVTYEEKVQGIDFSVLLSPLRDSDGKVSGVVGLALDISEKKRMERMVKESEETLKQIFDTTTDAMFIKDLDGIYMMANKSFSGLFNKTPKEIVGKSDSHLFQLEKVTEARNEDLEVVRTGRTMNFTRPRTLPTGSYYFNTIKTPMRNFRGETTGVLGISRDITSIKSMESELALTRASEAVSKMTRPIAHDFNNALAAISGYATLIDDDLAASSPIKTEISRIIEAVRRAAVLTSKLQDFARNPKIENPGETGDKKDGN
ncbi:MAG: PAS domain S-box protein [Elusimicrobiales bacterium]|nr:PAS domain S-box protein [Elusimicrobiales bacterium]